MENIEQLKLDNAKLTERLNNAAKFFREQKAQIEQLTSNNKANLEEIDNLKRELESYVQENEELKRKPKDDYVSTEKESLNKQLNEYEVKLQNSEAAYEELRKKYSEIKELHDGDLSRYNELEDNYEGLQNNYKELKEMYDNEITELGNNYEGLQNKYKDLKDLYDGEINRFNEQQSAYENKITLLEEDNIKLGNDVHEQIEYIDKMTKDHEVVINDLKKEIKMIEDQSNKVMDSYEKDLNKVNKEKQQLEIQLNNHLERIGQLESTIKTLQATKTAYDELLKFKEEIRKLVNMSESHVTKKTENTESHRMGSDFETKGFSL